MENREIAKQVYPDVEGYLDQVEHDRIQFIRGLEYSNKHLLDEIERLKETNQQQESDIKRFKSIQSQETTRADELQNEVERLKSELKDKEWISVEDRLPNCWSQHNKDYASGYLLGYTKYKEVEVVQLWNNIEWESESNELDYITHWMPLPNQPK